MKLAIHSAALLAAVLIGSVAQAQSKSEPVKAAAKAPTGVEAQVAARFAERAGNKPEQVFKAPAGLYEVLVRGEIFYVDADVNFVIAGRMFGAKTREDLTQKRLDTALKVDFKALPFDRAIKTVRGNGSRVLVTFEDPNCPYCKKLWGNIAELKNVTIYTFLYPILSAESMEKSKAIWCAKDRAATWDDYMVQGKAPSAASADCKTPLEENLATGRDLGINGTPTLIFADGSRGAGAVPLDVLEKRLAAVKK